MAIPRWIIYFQAALLGMVATTFFVFGIMVGNLTSSGNAVVSNESFSVTGTVRLGDSFDSPPDAGAVVIFLPTPPPDLVRQDPTLIRPTSFVPLENPTIDWIRSMGGTVVRSNIDGNFEVFGKPGAYTLLVISNTRSNATDAKLSKKQVATISQYFLPVDQLIEKQDFFWKTMRLEKDVLLEPIVFN